MKKFWKVLYVLAVVSVLLVPSIGMALGAEVQPSANEVLSKTPSVTKKDGTFNTAVLNDTANYVGDHFAARKTLATWWAELNASVLHTSVDDQIIVGKDSWLFYADTSDDYCGIPLSDAQLEEIAVNLAKIRDYVEGNGGKFVFTIAPNKNSLYPDNMPDRFRADHNNSTAERLESYLAEYGITYVNLFDTFEGKGVLYFKTDSHWDNRGAALAADALLNASGRGTAFFDMGFGGSEEHRGDLYEMLYPAGKMTETNPVIDYTFSFVANNAVNNGMAMRIETVNENADGKLVCWRDSFGSNLYPYLSEAFGEAVYSRSETYDFVKNDASGADVVIIEIVERNLYRLTGGCVILPEA